MICKACGSMAEEIRPNHYRCNYCGNEFSVSGSEGGGFTEPKLKNSAVLSGEEIYDKSINSVVEIYATAPGSNGYACSTGFVVSEQGLILTNAHAVLDDYGQIYKDIRIKSRTGVYRALVVAIGKPADNKHNSVDLCLLYADGFHAKAESFGDATAIKNGQKVYLIGNSLGMGSCITSGIVSDKARAMPGLEYTYIMTDVAANHGNSGGPLYNEKGEIIGVLVSGIDDAEGMNYAIPSNVADLFLAYVVKNTELGKAHISELEKYNTPMAATYAVSLAVIFTGVRLAVDVVEYIIKLFKK